MQRVGEATTKPIEIPCPDGSHLAVTVSAGGATATPGDTTASTWWMRATRANAASVCATIGWPATRWYCFGCAVPAREPVPAQGSRAWQRGAEAAWAGMEREF